MKALYQRTNLLGGEFLKNPKHYNQHFERHAIIVHSSGIHLKWHSLETGIIGGCYRRAYCWWRLQLRYQNKLEMSSRKDEGFASQLIRTCVSIDGSTTNQEGCDRIKEEL